MVTITCIITIIYRNFLQIDWMLCDRSKYKLQYMEHQKISIRIYHVHVEETKQEGEGGRMCQRPLLLRV